MAKFNIRAILGLILLVWGFGMIWQAGSQWLAPIVGGNPLFGVGLGIILLVIGAFVGKKSISSIGG